MRYLSIILCVLLFSCQPQASEQSGTPAPAPLYTYDVEARLDSLGIELQVPTMPTNIPIAPWVQSGNYLYLSGMTPRDSAGNWITGKLGQDMTVEEGYQAARLVGISQIARIKAQIGDLNKVVRIVKVLGMVNAAPDFTNHPQVVNGLTELMIEVFGERGRHARSAVGMSSIPFGAACEIEVIVEVQP